VFFNLFKNAAFEMAVSNREEPIISINTRLENNGIRIEISDNGPGMDENAKKRAFDPFYTTKGVGEGTGLGLSVSYFIIVDKHKGKIWIEDSEYGGAKFVIVLPVVNSEK
jgi:signal transduction histidine kinase